MHFPQRMHLARSMTDFPSTMEIAPFGHAATHAFATQPRHWLLTSYTLSSHASHAEGITCMSGRLVILIRNVALV